MPIADPFRLVWTPFLKRVDGRVKQAVALVCPTVLGSGGEFTLEMSGRRHRAHTLDLLRYASESRDQDLPIHYLWLVPKVTKPTPVHVTWKTPLGATHRASLLLLPAEPSRVHAVFKTHLDLGYTDSIANVIHLYQTRFMDRLLENLDATAGRPDGKRFVWTLSTWLLEQCLDPRAVDANQLRKLEHHIRKGSVVWGLMPFTTHSEFFGLEEMCRSIYAARRLAERFDRPVPRTAKMTDVPAHTASLAMAFATAGGNFFQIGTNPESIPPDVPPLFWWKLPDGQRILCHYRGTYGTPLLPPQDWPWREWLAVQITNDNLGPQSLWALDRMDWISKHFDYPVMRTGQLEDFADAVIREHGDELPVVYREVTDWWIYGIGSMAARTALARVDKERLPAAESLAGLAGLAWDGVPHQGPRIQRRDWPAIEAARVRDAYEQLTLYTEHTWGDHATDARALLPQGNQYTSQRFTSLPARPPVDRWISSWNDKAAFADRAHSLVERIERDATAAFADVIVSSSSQAVGKAESRTRKMSHASSRVGIALLNVLNWSRGGPVRVNAKDLPAGDLELVDPTTGETIPYERDGREIVFVAPPVPACGYLVLEVKPVSQREPTPPFAEWYDRMPALHTSEYMLQFHKAGGLARWHDRARSTQWCSDEVDFPMGTYLYEMPGGKQLRDFSRKVHSNSYAATAGYFQRHDYAEMSSFGPVGGGAAKITHQVTPVFARVIVDADCPARKVPDRRSGDAQRYRTSFTLYRGRREMHVRMELFGKRPTYAAEAGYAFFPLSGKNPCIFIDRIGHIMDPAQDLAPRVNAAHMAVGRGVRIQQDHTGMNFYPLHTPLVSFGQPGLYRFEKNGRHGTGILYATLFNNGWGTNFAQWQSGDFTFDFVLQPTGNDGDDGGLQGGGAEMFRPLVASIVKTPVAEPAGSLLSIEPSPSVQLVTIKPAEWEKGNVLRLWNTSGEPVIARVRWPGARRGSRVWKCDLIERRKERVIVTSDGEARLGVRSNEIVTLLLQGRV